MSLIDKLTRYEVHNGRPQVAPWGGYLLVGDVNAALAAQGEVTITKDPQGRIVAVTRTDSEGRILEVLAESAPGTLLQDACRELSVALSNTPDARRHAREAAAEIASARITDAAQQGVD